MLRNTLDKLNGRFAVGAWGTAQLVAEKGGVVVSLANPAIGGAMLASALVMQLRASNRDACADALDAARKKVERETLAKINGHVEHLEAIEHLFGELGQLLNEAKPTIAELVEEWRLDPETIASNLILRVLSKSEVVSNDHVARQLVAQTIVRAVNAIKDDPDHFSKLQATVARQILSDLKSIREDIDGLREAVDNLPATIAVRIGDREALVADLAAIRERYDATISLIADFLRRMVDREVPPDQFAATLYSNMERWKAAGERVSELALSTNLTPELSRLKDDADAARFEERIDDFWRLIEKIDRVEQQAFDRLDHRFRELENEHRARRDDLLRTKAGKRDAALATLRLAEAARAITEIVDLETPDPGQRFTALGQVQNEWFERGRDKGLNLDLSVAIEIAHIRVARAVDRDEKGAALNELGNALATLGQRESGTIRLEEAVTTLRTALREFDRIAMPFGWAMVQCNLGIALNALGELDAGTARLEEAVTAYCAALEEFSYERTPFDWATTMNNLGTTFHALSQRENPTHWLEKAVAAYRESLRVRTRKRVPLQWAKTQNNLGNALATLGQRQRNGILIEQAVEAYHAALGERTRERVPLEWAETQNNLGNALAALGLQENGTTRLEQALNAYKDSLGECDPDQTPKHWARTHMNMSKVYFLIFQKSGNRGSLTSALNAVDDALSIFRKSDSTHLLEMGEDLKRRILAAF